MEEDKKVCHECIGEEYVKSHIKMHGKRNGRCSYCLRLRKSLPYGDIADMMHTVFEVYYRPNFEEEHYWDSPRGDDAKGVIYDELKVENEELVDDIYNYLDQQYNPWGPDEYEKYNESFNYLKVNYESGELDLAWDKMLQSLKSEARYFNDQVRSFLDELFQDIDTYRLKGSASPVKEISEKTIFFRARVFETLDDVEVALKHPEREFGPPPSKIARSGRMNAPGIPVFYGAASTNVAIAEVRPPVGSYVVVAPFETLRTLRVLDISAMELIVQEKGSKFNPETIERLEKSSFLRTLSKRLTMPVPGRNTESEYLITQVIAECLSMNKLLKLDGITFNSTQVSKQNRRINDRYNVVLFRKSASVNDADNIRCEYNVEMVEHIEDGYYMFNPTIRKIMHKVKKNKRSIFSPQPLKNQDDYVLKLRVDEISFFEIEGVVFEVKRTGVVLGESLVIEKEVDDEWDISL